jgi:hypothetical protein
VIFYDNTLEWPRIVKLTGDFDYLLKTVSSAASDISTIPQESTASPPIPADLSTSTGLERLIRHSIFPKQNSYSNTYRALAEAFYQLSTGKAPGTDSSDFVVLIGDFLANCTTCPPGSAVGCKIECSNDYSHYSQAAAEIKSFAKTQAAPAHVPIHVLMTGKHVAPHTMDWAKPNISPAQCYSDNELRTLGNAKKQWVMGGDATGTPYASTTAWNTAFNTMSEDNPFYQANSDAYLIAMYTQGIFGALREVPPNCTAGACLDGQRRTTDPQCRSVQKQVNDFMATVIGSNPYKLVSTN